VRRRAEGHRQEADLQSRDRAGVLRLPEAGEDYAPFQDERFEGNTPAYDLYQVSLAEPLLRTLTSYVDRWVGDSTRSTRKWSRPVRIDFGFTDAADHR